MSNELVPYSDMERMAQAITKSGLFGMKTVEQTLALMCLAQAEGRHPAIVARDYDIINNRPSKKAEAMLRDFIAGGGRVEWHRMDDECADATFSHVAGGTVRITWDMKRAQQAELKGKDMYRKYPRQMLRSRTVSEGVRAVGPFATSGLYVPEEVQEFEPREPQNVTPEKPAEAVPETPWDGSQTVARGKYKDSQWRDLPGTYLAWCVTAGKAPEDMKAFAGKELKRRESEELQPLPKEFDETLPPGFYSDGASA